MATWDDARNIVGALPPQDRIDFVMSGVGDLPTDERKRLAANILSGLTPSDRREIVSGTVLGAPTETGPLMRLWSWVLLILGASILLFGGASLWLLLANKSAEGMIALVSLALGAVAGLLAPSPTAGEKET